MRISLFFLKLLSLLPVKILYVIGGWFGALLKLTGIKKKVINANLDFCFPDLAEKDKTTLISKSYKSLGKGAVELPMLAFKRSEALEFKVTVKNLALYETEKAKHGQLILLGHHTNHSELILIHLAKILPIAVLYRPNDNTEVNNFIQKHREKHLTCISKFQTKAAIKWLRKGNDLLLTPDQDHGHTNTKFVPLFGNKVATLSTPLRLAKLSGAIILPLAYHKISDREIEVEFLPPIDQSSSEQKALIQLNQDLEYAIQKAPEQYFWVHRRFKTLPDGQKSIYN